MAACTRPGSLHVRKTTHQRQPFQEIPGAAFFLGKLNKDHNRDQIYNALRDLTRVHGFYIRKLDMPYGNKLTKQGNQGYGFVHCRSREEAQRLISMEQITLLDTVCEVKPYGSRGEHSTTSSGYVTPLESPRKESDLRAILQQKYAINHSQMEYCGYGNAGPGSSKEDIYDSDATPVKEENGFDSALQNCTDNVYRTEVVNNFVAKKMFDCMTTEADGGLKFLMNYFKIYEKLMKEFQVMPANEILKLANEHAVVLV